MNKKIKEYLFEKNVLVADSPAVPNEMAECVVTLASAYGIELTKGVELLSRDVLVFLDTVFPRYVPKAFYQGFPDSVKELGIEQKVLDQLLHYVRTYAFGDFTHPGHSIFEKNIKRKAFGEWYTPRLFELIDENAAKEYATNLLCGLLASTRPLNTDQIEFVVACITEYGCPDVRIASKDTVYQLLLATKDLKYASLLSLSDVIGFVSRLNYDEYGLEDVKDLHFTNQDRKLVAAVIDHIFRYGRVNEEECYEKRAAWCGLLHHIHYRPVSNEAAAFVKDIREGNGRSVYSVFEELIAEGRTADAARYLASKRTGAAVLRKLNYLVSRSKSEDDIHSILEATETKNSLVLMQLLLSYASYSYEKKPRAFCFNRFNMSYVHRETEDEVEARKSILSKEQVALLRNAIFDMLKKSLKGKITNVYIDPDMALTAPPISEGTSMGGLGVLPKGSRIKLNAASKIIRAFTYWEKIDDIDLSAMATDEAGTPVASFYWANVSYSDNYIVFSGDQTSGYKGGSEFFDVDINAFAAAYPRARYLIFCNNTYSSENFSECVCRAGYMIRDIISSGEIYEPKTVKSSFTINCDSRAAYLFAIDLKASEIVWLNIASAGKTATVISNDFESVNRYLTVTRTINLELLFEMMAAKRVTSPDDADVIVSDKPEDGRDGKTVIHSYSFEEIFKLIN